LPNIKSPASHLLKDVKVSVPKGFGSRPEQGSKKAVADRQKIQETPARSY
jgi:hypothetical protein